MKILLRLYDVWNGSVSMVSDEMSSLDRKLTAILLLTIALIVLILLVIWDFVQLLFGS